MERFEGVLRIELRNEGSRSEGRFALLEGEHLSEPLQLCRREERSFEEDGFAAYDGMRVEIRGELSHGWLVVDSIAPLVEPAPEEPTEEPTPTPEEEQ